jgi:spermidine synthase
MQFEAHRALHSKLRRVFKIVRPYYAHVPSFDVPWAFLAASNDADPLQLNQRAVDRVVKRRINGTLSFYDGVCHVGLFNIPKHIRTRLHTERRSLSKANPVFTK